MSVLLLKSAKKKYLLDYVPGAVLACANKKLRSDYKGPIVRGRRSTDNAEKDFYLKGDKLNFADVQNFGATVYASRWYNQAVGANRYTDNGDFTQGVAASQPRIEEDDLYFDYYDDNMGNGYFDNTDFPQNECTVILYKRWGGATRVGWMTWWDSSAYHFYIQDVDSKNVQTSLQGGGADINGFYNGPARSIGDKEILFGRMKFGVGGSVYWQLNNVSTGGVYSTGGAISNTSWRPTQQWWSLFSGSPSNSAGQYNKGLMALLYPRQLTQTEIDKIYNVICTRGYI